MNSTHRQPEAVLSGRGKKIHYSPNGATLRCSDYSSTGARGWIAARIAKAETVPALIEAVRERGYSDEAFCAKCFGNYLAKKGA